MKKKKAAHFSQKTLFIKRIKQNKSDKRTPQITYGSQEERNGFGYNERFKHKDKLNYSRFKHNSKLNRESKAKYNSNSKLNHKPNNSKPNHPIKFTKVFNVTLCVFLLALLLPSFALANSDDASQNGYFTQNASALSDTYITSKTKSDTEYKMYVDKGRGTGDQEHIVYDSFLSVTKNGEVHDAWCVDITRLYPKGVETQATDAREVIPQDRLTKLALAHNYTFAKKDGAYVNFGEAAWAQRYAIMQAYAWWVMQHCPGTGMENYTIYSIEVINGEGGWGSSWSSVWSELCDYIKQNESLYKGSGTAFVSSEAQTVATWFSVEKQVGNIELNKDSAAHNLSDNNACYSLSGAEYGIYADETCTSEVARLTTNAQGYAKAQDIMVGTYWVREISAPFGFALDETCYSVEVTSGKTVCVSSGTVFDEPLNNELSLLLIKHDDEKEGSEEANEPQGDASLEGAEFRVRHYGGYFESAQEVENSGEVLRTWTFVSDAKGLVTLTEENKLSGDELYYNKSGNVTFPLGTYVINEIKAPTGYLLNENTYVEQVKPSDDVQDSTKESSSESQTSAPAAQTSLVQTYVIPQIPNKVMRGDLELIKVDEATQARMANIPFEIISNTTGERHVLVTDENGYASTSSSHVSHKENTNANDNVQIGADDNAKIGSDENTQIGSDDNGQNEEDKAQQSALLEEGKQAGEGVTETNGNKEEQQSNMAGKVQQSTYGTQSGIWFGDEKAIDDARGALIYDTYTINELPCAANASHVLVTNIQVRISKNNHLINLGTINNKAIGISTSASNQADGEKEMMASNQMCIVDKVSYEGLTPGDKYVLRGTLMDKTTKEPVYDEGTEVTGRTEFVPEEENGMVDVVFEFDGESLAGHDTVVFEELDRQIGEEEVTVVDHSDWENEFQTVRVKEEVVPDEVIDEPTYGETYAKTGIPLELLLAGIGVLGVAACAMAFYGTRQAKAAKRAGEGNGERLSKRAGGGDGELSCEGDGESAREIVRERARERVCEGGAEVEKAKRMKRQRYAE